MHITFNFRRKSRKHRLYKNSLNRIRLSLNTSQSSYSENLGISTYANKISYKASDFVHADNKN